MHASHPTRRQFLAGAAVAAIAPTPVEPTRSEPIGAGDHRLSLSHEGLDRPYVIHVPAGLNFDRPVPLVLALHPIASDGAFMAKFCRLDTTADREGFVVVYPGGSGRGMARTWNAGGVGNLAADDVGFIDRLIDELSQRLPVDADRVYATGMSNGGMMCYRLASELSERIAAIAAVSGTMAVESIRPTRPVPVIHFHGTSDRVVPIGGPSAAIPGFVRFLSVADTVTRWVEANGCPAEPSTQSTAAEPPGLNVRRAVYGPGRRGAEVVLYTMEGAGHVWPGVTKSGPFLGTGAPNVPANELIWEFFRRHPRV